MVIDVKNKAVFNEIDISEKEIQTIVKENFNLLFEGLTLIKSEFSLKGDVRLFGISGRVDILAYDKAENRLVVIEIKRDYSKNIVIQALDYADYIEENLEMIIFNSDNLKNDEKEFLLKGKKTPKILLIAKSYLHPSVKRAKKVSNDVSLYSYKAYSNGIFSLELFLPERKNTHLALENNIQSAEHLAFHIKEILRLGFVEKGYYSFDGENMFVSSNELYKAYCNYCENNELPILKKYSFLAAIRESEIFVAHKKAHVFTKKNTSAIVMKF